MANFVASEADTFNPEYGDVNWKRRLNAKLEDSGTEIYPVDYVEEGKPPMQVTQENTVIYINQIADELDCVAVKYDQDADDLWTWYFREKFANDDMFRHVVNVVGTWACVMTTIYPMAHVVVQYERFQEETIPDQIPEDFA